MHNMSTYRNNDWVKANGKPLANLDLWHELAFAKDKCPNVRVRHVGRDEYVPGNTRDARKVLRDYLRTDSCGA